MHHRNTVLLTGRTDAKLVDNFREIIAVKDITLLKTKMLHLKYLKFNLLTANLESGFLQNLYVYISTHQTDATEVPLTPSDPGSMHISHLRVTLLSCFLRVVITESQNVWGWKGPLWVTQSNPPAEAGSPRAGCTGPRPGRF